MNDCILDAFSRCLALRSSVTLALTSGKEIAMSLLTAGTFLNVFTVEDFDAGAGKKGSRWAKIGVAFPHRDGQGFNIELQAFPRDGRLVVLPPNGEEETRELYEEGDAQGRVRAEGKTRRRSG